MTCSKMPRSHERCPRWRYRPTDTTAYPANSARASTQASHRPPPAGTGPPARGSAPGIAGSGEASGGAEAARVGMRGLYVEGGGGPGVGP
ncbi:hypothetical protein GCM10010378_14180 [Streptomyces viridochromogenes]